MQFDFGKTETDCNMRVIKNDVIVKGIDFSTSFYMRLQQLAVRLGELKEKEGLETILILLQTIDKAAEEQGLTEDVDLNIVSGEE